MPGADGLRGLDGRLRQPIVVAVGADEARAGGFAEREAERSLQETRFIETTAANKIRELGELLAALFKAVVTRPATTSS